MRLIDAEELDVVSFTCPKGMDIDSFIEGMGAVLDRIYDAPTVEETIRCEDCKHFREMRDGVGVCERNKKTTRDYHEVCGLLNGDWFCADGEEREYNAAD